MPRYSYSSDEDSSSSDAESEGGNSSDGKPTLCCFRCGRTGHFANECFARTIVVQPENNNSRPALGSSSTRGVYALEDSDGKVYVGKSENIERRIEEHHRGGGTRFINKNSFRRISLKTPAIQSDLESWERNETLTQMYHRGIDQVRGWMYTTTNLSEDQQQDIFTQICEKFDLCRKCGRKGHFIQQCYARTQAHWV